MTVSDPTLILTGENRCAETELRALNESLEQLLATKATELELANAEIQNLIKFAPDAIVIIDHARRIVLISDQTEKLFGYEHAELIGQVIEILLPERYRRDHPKKVEGYLAEPHVRPMGQGLDLWGLRKDGREFPVEISLAPLQRAEGMFASASIRDITARREIESGLEKTRQELAVIKISADEALEYAESIINTVREPLIALDKDLRVVTASRSFYEVFKVNHEETVGQLIYDLGNKQWDIPKLRELLEDILPQKAAFDNYEVEHDFSAIGKRIMLLNARQIQRRSGQERIILLAIEDITEREETERALKLEYEERRRAEAEVRGLNETLEQRVSIRTSELEAVNKELDAFSYSVSHDLRSPLRHIGGFANLLGNRTEDTLSEKGKRYVTIIIQAVARMEQLIDDLLAFSRVGRTEMRGASIDVNALIREVLDSLAGEQVGRRIEFKIENMPEIHADRALMRLVFQNLIGNAVKYTSKREEAVIEIGCMNEGIDGLVFSVKDNGVGFDMKYEDKLFGVFQRLHTSEEFEGTGIGLANVRRIILRHGGKTWGESEVDHGATFYFSLPNAKKGD